VTIVVHSQTGTDFLALALRMQDEGHTVALYIEDPGTTMVGTGLIAHVPDFLVAADKADLVIFDQVGQGSLADKLREDGHAVIGAGRFQEMLEHDRIKGMEFLKAAGLRVPETEPFPDGDFDRAQAFVTEDGGRWVFKADDVESDKTFVAADADAMVAYLEHLNETIELEEGKRPPFILQRFVDGVEVSTERWYSYGEPLRALDNSTFETKKFLAGDLGVSVGCMGNVVLPHQDQRLLSRTVGRFDALAAAHDVTSPIDLNAIVSFEDGWPYMLEVTGRFGYYAIQAFCALWGMPIAETFYAVATGGTLPEVRFVGKVGAAIPVSMAPYPSAMQHERGTPIVDEILDDPDIWPADVMLDRAERVVVAGSDGMIYLVTGVGDTIEAAFAPCYRTLNKARMPDIGYRVDLVETLGRRFTHLQRLGYLRGSV
jgi:phosphoribosylamine--glycine ligase